MNDYTRAVRASLEARKSCHPRRVARFTLNAVVGLMFTLLTTACIGWLGESIIEVDTSRISQPHKEDGVQLFASGGRFDVWIVWADTWVTQHPILDGKASVASKWSQIENSASGFRKYHIERAVGFPFICVRSGVTRDNTVFGGINGGPLVRFLLRSSTGPPGAILPLGEIRSLVIGCSLLPFLPIWVALLGNVVIWGSACYLIRESASLIRGTARELKGKCARCGYPHTGGGTCPECGLSVHLSRGLGPARLDFRERRSVRG